jgi:hypothetical protein
MDKSQHPHVVEVDWSLSQEREDWWDLICIYAIEEFGLPGDRFITEAAPDYMKFYFRDPEDAMIMRLRWHIV